MRNAKTSPLRNHGLKNGTNRDGNEGIRKGLGCTNRSVRMDWFKPGITGNHGPMCSPLANKLARTVPLFAMEEDGIVPTFTMTDKRAKDEALDVLDWERERYWEDFDSIFLTPIGDCEYVGIF
jgi:hypothetical protein